MNKKKKNETLLFTEKLAKQDLTPSGLRDGTRLLFFKYTPGGNWPFSGVTDDGGAYMWNKYGHLNGTKRKMKTDLVYSPTDPAEVTVNIGRTYNGNFYALNPGGDLMKSSYTPYSFILNTETGEVRNGRVFPLVTVQDKTNEKKQS